MRRLRRIPALAALLLATAGALAAAGPAAAQTASAQIKPAQAGIAQTGNATAQSTARTVGDAAADASTITTGAAVAAAANRTVTFVNRSGQTLWIGSSVNADGSKNLTNLPVLADGQSATVTIPENADPYHWRGKFFARQGCTGNSGSTFHCQIADCGPYADHCTTGEQPASLAEFNFDTQDSLAPWYNVSYVNAFSLPVTISPNNAPAPPAGGGSCEAMGCSQDLLPYCPSGNVSYDSSGRRILCTNPNRDAQTPYSDAITSHCPKAYSWSKQDTVPGNQVMRQCANCTGFTVTFHGTSGGGGVTGPTGQITGLAGKCVDVDNSNSANGTRVQLYTCNGTDAQKWTIASDGTVRALGKCLDVSGGNTANGTKIQLYDCNGTAAQKWVYSSGRDIVNPQANKCLDVTDVNSADSTPLQIWECNGGANQKWNIPS